MECKTASPAFHPKALDE